jgi:hypothetical protein
MSYCTEENQTKNRTRGIICCVFYGLALLVATHISLGEVKEHDIYIAQKEFYLDKLIQFSAYCVFAILVGFSFIPISKDASETVKDLNAQKMVLIGGAICLFATLDECTQPFFGRTLELSDFVANVFGIAVGLVAFIVLNEFRQHLD